MDLTQIANQNLLQLEPYKPGKPIEMLQRELGLERAVKLASNECLLGTSPKAVNAIKQHAADIFRYPETDCHELLSALAEHTKLSPQQIVLSNGSDAFIRLICQAIIAPGDEVIVSEYAFVSYKVTASVAQAAVKTITAKNWGHDLAAMAAAVTDKTKLLVVVNPNNPTATYSSSSELEQLLDNIPSRVMVLIDEAYFEYMTLKDYPNSLKLMEKYPNIIIMRTFSKVHGLAGVRLGYAMAQSEIIDLINRVRLPFEVNRLATVAGMAALQDQKHVSDVLQQTAQGRKQICDSFKSLDIEYLTTDVNFITFKSPINAATLYQQLLQRGVIIRPLLQYGMPDHLRVTIGLPEENQLFINAISELLASM